jgi:CRP/FNR family cyclic AMP-dependent transcriptional regulator
LIFRKQQDERVTGLWDVPVFSGCTRRQLEIIAKHADEARLDVGTKLMQEGRVGHECFILLEGSADVAIRGKRVARIGAGDITGEMALLEHEPRSATVTTTTPVRALVLTQQGFDSILDAVPTVARRVMRALAHRLREVQAA